MTARRNLKAAVMAATVITALTSVTASAEAGSRARSIDRSHHYGYAPAARDCAPINGPHGYYANAWCDGGFLTLEEQEFRYAKRLDIDRHAYRYRDGRRRLIRAN